MALTAGFTCRRHWHLCVALNPTGFGDSMAVGRQWLYVLFVLMVLRSRNPRDGWTNQGKENPIVTRWSCWSAAW